MAARHPNMKIPKDLRQIIGLKFGNDCKIIEYIGIKACSHLFMALCFCGKKFKIRKQDIFSKKHPRTKCPQCYWNQHGKKLTKQMIGKKFGRWTVLNKSSERTPSGAVIYMCQCDCGTVKNVPGTALRFGNSQSCGCVAAEKSRKRRGPKHPNWRHDMTEEDREKQKHNRDDGDIKLWRQQVFERDNYICQSCGKRGLTLNAHHLDGFHWAVDRRYDLNNGITLCENCHKLFHQKFGIKDNIQSQYQDFIVQIYNG